jgi:ribosomal protein S18 acetylase RimI-like enzyme
VGASDEPEHPEVASRWAAYRPDERGRRRPRDLEVRPARRHECVAIAAIEARRDGVDVTRVRQRCEDQVADPETLLLVALVERQVVAFARAGHLRQPPEAPSDAIPDGWYLLGVVVVDAWRRRGIGRALTDQRLAWIARRANAAYYFANARNQASLELHAAAGFVEVTRRFSGPGISFEGGEGVLCRIDLSAPLSC